MTKALAIGAAAALAGAALAGAAQAQVSMTVTGGGYSLACAAAAKSGASGAKAEELCTTALNVEPMLPIDRAGTFVNRGVIRLRAQRFNDAIADFDTALEYRADMAQAFVNRGAAQIGNHRFAESLADFNKALALGVPEPEKAYYNRALAYEWLDDPKSAYLDYKKAQALAPDWGLVNQQLERFTVSHAGLKLPAAPNP